MQPKLRAGHVTRPARRSYIEGAEGGRTIREDWTRVLRRGEQAIRERLAKSAEQRASPAATEIPEIPEISHDSQATGEAPKPALPVPSVVPTELEIAAATEPSPPVEFQLDAEPPAVAEDTPGQPPPLPNIFAQLTTGDRIASPAYYRDRTLLFAAVILAGLALTGLATTISLSVEPPQQQGAEPQDKRGQVEKSETITVELVEAPDAKSKSKVSVDGEPAPPAPPPPLKPDEPMPPGPPEPEDQKAEPEKPLEQKAEKPAQKPLTVDDFDVSMADYAKAVDQAQAERQRRKAQQQRSPDSSRLAGAAPEGKQSPYVKSVLAVIAKNKPQLYINKGEVYVQFVLTKAGQLGQIRIAESSGDPLLDQIALNAIKTLKFPVPPADVPAGDLAYMIHYVMH